MKRYREGTLRGISQSTAAGDEIDLHSQPNPKSIYGLADFLEKAEKLAIELLDSGPVRAKTAAGLKLEVDRIRYLLVIGLDGLKQRDPNTGGRELEAALYDAASAALKYANLSNELRDDRPMRGKKKTRTTRTKYFAEKKIAAKTSSPRTTLARRLGLTRQGLAKWERENLK